MKSIKNHFNNEQIKLLSSIGIYLSNDKDYTDDELISMHEILTDKYLDHFNSKGDPDNQVKLFETIIDIFADDFEI